MTACADVLSHVKKTLRSHFGGMERDPSALSRNRRIDASFSAGKKNGQSK
jgi:hypothetical protein